jgi:polysaccharide transporter, PST family
MEFGHCSNAEACYCWDCVASERGMPSKSHDVKTLHLGHLRHRNLSRKTIDVPTLLTRFIQHRLVLNTGALVIVQIVTNISPLVALIYLSRVLGVNLYGIVAFAFAIVQLSTVLLDFGFSLSATQRISKNRHNIAYIERLLGSIFLIKLIGFFVIATAIVGYAITTQKYGDHRNLLILTLLPLIGGCFQPFWFFSGIERMRYITVFTVASKLLGLVLLLLLVSDKSTYHLAIVADGLGQIVGAGLALTLMFKLGYRPRWPRRREIMYTIKMTAPFFASRLAVTTYVSSGVLILGFCAPPKMVGAYAIAERLYQALQQVFAPLVQAIYPYMVRERALRLLVKVGVGCVGFALVCALTGYLAAPFIISNAFSGDAQAVLPVLNIFFFGLVIHVANVMSGHPLAAVLRKTDVANRSVVYGSLIYVISVGILIALDATTAKAFALAMVFSECLILGYRALIMWPIACASLRES